MRRAIAAVSEGVTMSIYIVYTLCIWLPLIVPAIVILVFNTVGLRISPLPPFAAVAVVGSLRLFCSATRMSVLL